MGSGNLGGIRVWVQEGNAAEERLRDQSGENRRIQVWRNGDLI